MPLNFFAKGIGINRIVVSPESGVERTFGGAHVALIRAVCH